MLSRKGAEGLVPQLCHVHLVPPGKGVVLPDQHAPTLLGGQAQELVLRGVHRLQHQGQVDGALVHGLPQLVRHAVVQGELHLGVALGKPADKLRQHRGPQALHHAQGDDAPHRALPLGEFPLGPVRQLHNVLARWRNRTPSSVRVRLRFPRRNRVTPSSRSRSLICRDRVGWVTWSRSAALVIFFSLATAR